MDYGEKIKALRKQAGLTQQQLGELCGYEGRGAECAVQNWEHNRQLPPITKLRALAQALQVAVDAIIP